MGKTGARLVWFVIIWLASVGLLGVVAVIIRTAIN